MGGGGLLRFGYTLWEVKPQLENKKPVMKWCNLLSVNSLPKQGPAPRPNNMCVFNGHANSECTHDSTQTHTHTHTHTRTLCKPCRYANDAIFKILPPLLMVKLALSIPLPQKSQSPHSHLTVTSQLRHSYVTVTSWRNPAENNISCFKKEI